VANDFPIALCIMVCTQLAQVVAPGFWQDLTPPPALQAFSAVTGSVPGDVSVTVDFPATISDYDRVEVRWIAGATPPAATCTNGAVLTTLTPPFTDPTVTTHSATESSYYSYRACIYDASGNLTASDTVANVQAMPACSGKLVSSVCWYYGATGQSCTTVCATHGGHAGLYTTSAGNCQTVLGQFGPNTPFGTGTCASLYGSAGVDCGYSTTYNYGRCNDATRTAGASAAILRRVCACVY
jgi:hypothetical protein